MKKLFKFSIKIDDDNHTLSKEDGLPFDKLAILLKDLYDAIDSKTGIKCTLGQIRGNCYALDFFTIDNKLHDNFVIVHKHIEQHTNSDLRDREAKYARTLNFVLGEKFSLKAYDKKGKMVAKLKQLSLKQEIEHYYSTKMVYGIFSEHGARDLRTKPHIFISGEDYKIYIREEQDLLLKPFYKTHELKFRLSQKISMKDSHVISAELIDFYTKSDGRLIDNLKKINAADLNLMRDISSSQDILKKLYGY